MSKSSTTDQSISERPNPSSRPADPAGTQPKVDPRSLESPPQLQAGQATFLPAPTAPVPEPASAPVPDADQMALDKPREPSPQHPHGPRFQFLLGALGALGICAIGLVVLLLSAPKAAPAKPWSAWHPADDGVDPAEQIASHVAPEYRLDDGKQIVQVTGGPPALKGQPLTLGEIRSGQQPARLEGNSVLYRMCGGGANCSIKEGKPSLQRGLLLSREALELALYTFRYVDGVSQVVVTIPPPPPTPAKDAAGKSATASATSGSAATASGTPATSTGGASSTPAAASHALMFRSEDVASALGHPLSYTLSANTPRVSQMDRSTDAPLVKQLTGTRLYDYIVDEVPQSGAVMLLEPPS